MKTKTPEDILTKLSNEKGYPSFPALIENELSLDVYDLVCKAMKTPEEKYIKITITEKDSEQIIDLKSKGLYDYEIVGLLTHYKDKMQIMMLNKTEYKMKTPNKIIKQCHVLLNRYTMLLQDGTPYVTEKGVEEALLLFLKLSLPSDEEIKNEMGKKTKYYDLAEMRALTIPVIMWRFCAYKTEKDYESGEHYFVKDFLDHTEMKVFSGKHSAKEKSLYPDYCSMYWKIKTNAT